VQVELLLAADRVLAAAVGDAARCQPVRTSASVRAAER
jgi:hypothetical protein